MMVDVLVDWNAVDINDVLSMIMEESYMIRIMFNTGQCYNLALKIWNSLVLTVMMVTY